MKWFSRATLRDDVKRSVSGESALPQGVSQTAMASPTKRRQAREDVTPEFRWRRRLLIIR